MISIEVAADTMRRFYRQVIEESRTSTKRFSKRERSVAHAPLNSPTRVAATSPIAGAAAPTCGH